MANKTYFDAYVVAYADKNNGQPTIMFRNDHEVYWNKKLKRHSTFFLFIDLPCQMTKTEAREWISKEFADNETVMQALQEKPAKSAPERLADIRARILAGDTPSKEQQELADILSVVSSMG